MKPCLSNKDIKRFERILLSQSKKADVLEVLEWGSGGSTLYFSDFLKKKGINFNWLSLEYNRNWYEKVSKEINDKQRTKIVLFDVGNNSLKQIDLPMNDYVDYPTSLNKKFDVIFVDGRKRRRCLLIAKNILNKNGIVILHDAERSYYHSAIKTYPFSIFIGAKLWTGKLESSDNFQKIKNKFSYFLNRFYFYTWLGPWLVVKEFIIKNVPFVAKMKAFVFRQSF